MRALVMLVGWRGEIENMEELMDITDDDIENVWYVKMLKGMGGMKEDE